MHLTCEVGVILPVNSSGDRKDQKGKTLVNVIVVDELPLYFTVVVRAGPPFFLLVRRKPVVQARRVA